MILKKIKIENFTTKEELYSKNIKGDLDFRVEVHQLQDGLILKLHLYRNHPRIEEIIEKGIANNFLGKQKTIKKIDESGILRVVFNDDKKTMIDATGGGKITITEFNFNPKDVVISDFQNGKVAILIDIILAKPIDNLNFKQEVKDFFKEE